MLLDEGGVPVGIDGAAVQLRATHLGEERLHDAGRREADEVEVPLQSDEARQQGSRLSAVGRQQSGDQIELLVAWLLLMMMLKMMLLKMMRGR